MACEERTPPPACSCSVPEGRAAITAPWGGAPALAAVQIHHVQPACAEPLVVTQQLLGSRRVTGLGGEVPLVQAHAASGRIDGGDELHCLEPQEILEHPAAPVLRALRVELCPQKFSRRTTADTAAPYWALARVCCVTGAASCARSS